MKKQLLALVVALSTTVSFAATAPQAQGSNPAQGTPFEKAEQLYNQKNYPAAYQEIDRLAKTGNAQAIYNLGFMTELGQGTSKDAKKALRYYEEASNKSYSVATYRLAQIYSIGDLGVAKDAQKSRQYLEKASNAGFDEATVELAVLLFAENKPASDQLALQKLNPLIKQNNYRAMHLKAIYDISQGFKTKNEATVKSGLSTIETLAKKGYVPALMAVGNMMANGNIVPQNLDEAKKIFTALAQENVPQAKESLAAVNKLIAEKAKAPAAKSKS
ncbi:tetratricopeptide repeat protein [uncultured Acinetobacter sp.]|uniref:tetratricopeptide repeat protein n=1 Tax=uncultured Acinetobacter sp. TaxID=165433 RepID=UPI00258545EE|nr:tetratricopeptide repeat protein [uncultured Acinetobacter sp.]